MSGRFGAGAQWVTDHRRFGLPRCLGHLGGHPDEPSNGKGRAHNVSLKPVERFRLGVVQIQAVAASGLLVKGV